MAFATWYLADQNTDIAFLDDCFLSVRWITAQLAAESYKHLISIPPEMFPKNTPSGAHSGGAFTWFD